MLCPKCGQQNATGRFCSNCGSQLPPASGATPAAPPPDVSSYAGFWKRLAAFILDYVIVMLLAALAGGVIGAFYGTRAGAPTDETASGLGAVAGILVWWLYYALMESSSRQATLGKMALGIKVVDQQGKPVSFARATMRTMAKLLSGMILMVGYLMAGFTSRKQALHDILAGCLVVNRIEGGAATGMPVWATVPVVLVAMVFPVAILAAIALPAYQDYAARARVAIAVQAGHKATQAIETFYARNNALPRDLAEAGMPDPGLKEIRQLNVDQRDGAVRIVLAVTPLDGKAILFVPHRDNNNRVVWTCRSEDVPQRYLPPHCRQEQGERP